MKLHWMLSIPAEAQGLNECQKNVDVDGEQTQNKNRSETLKRVGFSGLQTSRKKNILSRRSVAFICDELQDLPQTCKVKRFPISWGSKDLEA